MKRLLIMRHAKSDWDSGAQSDFERPLNKRGQKDALFMGEFIKEKNIVPDIIFASPAKRAKETTVRVVESSGYSNELVYLEEFYFGNISAIIDKLQTLSDNINTVLLVGHNPIFESLCELLSDKNTPVSMPTAAIVYIKLYDNWTNLEVYRNRLEWIVTPKSLRK